MHQFRGRLSGCAEAGAPQPRLGDAEFGGVAGETAVLPVAKLDEPAETRNEFAIGCRDIGAARVRRAREPYHVGKYRSKEPAQRYMPSRRRAAELPQEHVAEYFQISRVYRRGVERQHRGPLEEMGDIAVPGFKFRHEPGRE